MKTNSLNIRCYKVSRPSQDYVNKMVREAKEKLNKIILKSESYEGNN